jgi:hypothetical protein
MRTMQEKLVYAFGTFQATMMARYGMPKIFQTLADTSDTLFQHA